MSGTGNWCVLLLLAVPAAAQEPDPDDAPATVQSQDHFYGAVGPSVRVEWSADRTEVPVGGDITLTLTVRGATNPHRVRRPPLRELPAFAGRFQITDGTDPRADRTATEVRFTYTLRPRSAAVDQIPELRFAYYHPSRQLRTTFATKLPLKVLPPAAAAAPPQPLEAPERFFRLADDYRETEPVGWAGWLGLILAVPAATAVWVVLWRLRNPDGVRLARLRRNRAVASALDALARAAKSPDPAANAAAAVRVYLIERWGMPPAAAVPAEVAAALAGVEWPADRVAAAVEFFRKCDAARFAPAGDTRGSLVEDARGMILGWEGDG